MNIEFIVKESKLEYSDEIVYKIGVPNIAGGVRNELLAAFTNTGSRCYEKLRSYKSTRQDVWSSAITNFHDKEEAEDFCNFLNGALVINSLRGE